MPPSRRRVAPWGSKLSLERIRHTDDVGCEAQEMGYRLYTARGSGLAVRVAHFWRMTAPTEVTVAESFGMPASRGVPYDDAQGNLGTDGTDGTDGPDGPEETRQEHR